MKKEKHLLTKKVAKQMRFNKNKTSTKQAKS